MFLQNKGDVTMTIELLDTEEAQADDPLDVQVKSLLKKSAHLIINVNRATVNKVLPSLSVPVELHGAVCGH